MELLLINWNRNKINLKSRKVRGEDRYIVEAEIKEKEIKFKSDKRHKAKVTPEGIYYACNSAVGKLSRQQQRKKTNLFGKRITCVNCRRFHKNKR